MRMLEMLQNVNFKSKPETDSALKFRSKMATRLRNLICYPDCNSSTVVIPETPSL